MRHLSGTARTTASGSRPCSSARAAACSATNEGGNARAAWAQSPSRANARASSNTAVVDLRLGVAAEEQGVERLGLLADQRQPQAVGVAGLAEALQAEVVRHPALAQALEDRARVGLVRASAPHAQSEPVAAQVADLELVAVRLGPGDLQLIVAQGRDVDVGARALHRDHLPGHGARVLEAGVADRAPLHAQPLGQAAQGLVGADPALLEAQVEVLALAGRLVERDLLDLEVFGLPADLPWDRGQVGAEIRPHQLGGDRGRAPLRLAGALLLGVLAHDPPRLGPSSSTVSSRIVTGPALTSSTSIEAPKRPVATVRPLSRRS